MKKVYFSVRWLALVVAFGALGLGMAFATPVGARQVGGEHTTAGTTNTPNITSGAAALVGIDEEGLLSFNDEALAKAVAAGATWSRTELDWADYEPIRGGAFVWPPANLDPLLKLSSGLAPVVYISKNPAWASALPCEPIDTNDASLVTDFGNFMGALATHYPNVKIWGLSNEPDSPTGNEDSTSNGCFASSSAGGLNNNGVKDYIEYAIMLKTAWKAVHTANPNAKVAIGALALDSFTTNDQGQCVPSGYPKCDGQFRYDFTTNLFGYIGKTKNVIDGGKYADMVLFNYYELYGPLYWELKYPGHGIQAKTNAIRVLMKQANMPTLPLLVTETGLPSVMPWDSTDNKTGQARCLNITMVRGAAAKLQGIVWWTFRDYNDNDPLTYRETWKYGIVDQDMNVKPAYTAMQVLVSELNAFKYSTTVSGTSGFAGVEGYTFKSGKVIKYAVWSSTIASKPTLANCSWTRTAKMVTFTANKVKVVDYMGGVTTIQDNKKGDKNKTIGQIGFKVAADPKFVTINPK
jgi:hypothetical protein